MKKNTAFLIENEDQLARFFTEFKSNFWITNFETVKMVFKTNKYAADNFGTITLTTEDVVVEKELEIIQNPYAEKPAKTQEQINEIVLDSESSIEYLKEDQRDFKDIKNLFKIVKLPIPGDDVIDAIIDAWNMKEKSTENILKFVLKHEK